MKRVFADQIQIAAQIWDQIKISEQPADRWLGNFFHANRKDFGSKDRRFYAEVTYALFRHKLFLELWAESLVGNKESETLVFLAAVLEKFIHLDNALELAQPAFPKNIPLAEVLEKVQTHQFPSAFNPKNLEEELSYRYSFPDWMIRRWLKRLKQDECQKMLAIFQKRPPLTIRTNSIKINRAVLLKQFESRGYEVRPTEISRWGIVFKERENLFGQEEFKKGLFEIQDEASQVVCQRIAPKPGDVVWDVCAGGGGKSLALAAMMKNKGRIIATDIRANKLEELKKRAKRAGIFNIFAADMTRLDESREVRIGFDKILVDAPCSGTGTLRRNPDAKWKLKEEKFKKFHEDQVAIIERSLPRLKKGGMLFYVTCSIEPDEHESVIREVLSKNPQMQIVADPETKKEFFRMLPEEHNTDGFFMAVLIKRELSPNELAELEKK